ncbi:MAG: hypothetical protein IT318_26385 [Anaerolineales bacterium]|nr:hypothetical protein [Anaerolineales bacterium]
MALERAANGEQPDPVGMPHERVAGLGLPARFGLGQQLGHQQLERVAGALLGGR